MRTTIYTLALGWLLAAVAPAALAARTPQWPATPAVPPAPRAVTAPAAAPRAPAVPALPLSAAQGMPALRPEQAPSTPVALAAPVAPIPTVRRELVRRPPRAWAQGDPADSIYRQARESLNRGEYGAAARGFGRITSRYPRSSYAADAYYWRAYALYRQGGSDNLQSALTALSTQRAEHPRAATRGDAEALAVRIRGELARTGDAAAAESIAVAADAMRAEAAQRGQERAQSEQARAQARQAQAQARQAAREAGREAAEAARSARGAGAVGTGRSDQDSLPAGCARDENADLRAAALNALLQMDAERALPVLKDVLERRDRCSAPLRRKAVFLVAQGGTPEAADVLLDVARNDPNAGVREQAVFWLSQVSSAKALPALEEILKSSKDPALQERTLFALSQQDDPKAGAVLRDFAGRSDVPESLREKAVFWIGQRGGAADVQYLEQLFGRTSDGALKERILFAISQTRAAGHAQWLLGVARDAHQPLKVRKKALFWAGQAGISASDLAGLYRSAADSAFKAQLIFVLSQSKAKAAVDQLIDIARNEKNPALRKKAIFWLGQSQDPRAVKVLQEIVSHD